MTGPAGSSFALRCLVAVSMLTIYGAGASWIVRREGRASRESLRSAEEGESKAPPPAPGPLALTTAREAERRDSSVTPRPRPPEPPRTAAPEPTAPTTPKDKTPIPPKAEPPVAPLWNNPEVKRVWDLKNLTAAEEFQLGQVLHALILNLNPQAEGGPWKGRLQEAAESLRKGRHDAPSDFTYTVLESDVLNAFSHPGGFIYVTRTLLDSIGEDEPYALQFVVAHEMAHLKLHHALLCLQAPDMKKLMDTKNLGTVESLYNFIIPLAYPDNMEYEADRWALERMAELGHGRREALAFLRKLEAYARTHGISEGRGRPDPRSGGSVIDNHLRAHVSAPSRLLRAKEFWDARPAPTR